MLLDTLSHYGHDFTYLDNLADDLILKSNQYLQMKQAQLAQLVAWLLADQEISYMISMRNDNTDVRTSPDVKDLP